MFYKISHLNNKMISMQQQIVNEVTAEPLKIKENTLDVLAIKLKLKDAPDIMSGLINFYLDLLTIAIKNNYKNIDYIDLDGWKQICLKYNNTCEYNFGIANYVDIFAGLTYNNELLLDYFLEESRIWNILLNINGGIYGSAYHDLLKFFNMTLTHSNHEKLFSLFYLKTYQKMKRERDDIPFDSEFHFYKDSFYYDDNKIIDDLFVSVCKQFIFIDASYLDLIIGVHPKIYFNLCKYAVELNYENLQLVNFDKFKTSFNNFPIQAYAVLCQQALLQDKKAEQYINKKLFNNYVSVLNIDLLNNILENKIIPMPIEYNKQEYGDPYYAYFGG